MAYRAFVASTFEDLKAHRAHVIQALRKAGFWVDPMEDWTSSPGEPTEFSQERMEGCDLCILLVALRRGHIPEGKVLSITQLEYQAAVRLGIDVLVFMLDEQAPWPRRFDELQTDQEIGQWRKQLLEHLGVGFFGLDPSSVPIESALTRWLAKRSERARENRVQSRLTLRQGGPEGKILFDGNAALVRIGRDPTSEIVLPQPASWEHGRILLTGGVYAYEHLGTRPALLRRRYGRPVNLSRESTRQETLHQLDEIVVAESFSVSVHFALTGDTGYTPTDQNGE